MADAKHLERFKQGVKNWNQWRRDYASIAPDLSGADLRKADIARVNFSNTDLSKAILSQADLSDAKLRGADLCGTDLSETRLKEADLREAYLRETILRGAYLKGAYLRESKLLGADLSEADISRADLYGANLYKANLCGANLYEANLYGAQVLDTDLSKAILTGACLEDWNVNGGTNFDDAICEYVYLKAGQQERRPRDGVFKPGEFAALFQQAVDTVDLIFKDGIDWQVFVQSFQDIRSQYTDENLSIQAIERKQGGAFVIRLEVAEGSNKQAIESSAKELYETKLVLVEQRYRAELQAKDGEIVAYREQSANLMKITEMLAARPPMSEGNKYDLRGAQFGGGYVAGNVEGNQYGGIINNYGSNAEDITRLLAALRDQAQTFPTDQKDDANDVLDDLERDLADEQPDQGRIGRRLKKLVALGAAIGTIASGAAAISGDVSTFTGNVIELTEQLGIPVEQVQPEQLPSSD